MIDDLFNNIIKKLLAMPRELHLQSSSYHEFLRRCDRICNSQRLTPAAYANDFVLHPETQINDKDKITLQNYVTAICDITQDIDFFITLSNYACYEIFNKTMDADLCIPYIYKLMPRNEKILPQLTRVLEFSTEVNSCHRYLLDFHAIAKFLLESGTKSLSGDAEEDARTDKKINLLLDKLRDPSQYAQLYLLIKINSTCVRRMQECYDAIFKVFAENNIHDFDNDSNDMEGYQKIDAQLTCVLNMFAQKDLPIFTSHPDVWKNIRKFIAYQEFHNTIIRGKDSVFERLREIVYKYPHFEAEFAEDLDNVVISLPSSVRAFFIPDKSYTMYVVTLSFLWSQAAESPVPLRLFMDSFVAKIKALEAANEIKAAQTDITPPAMTA